MPTLETWVLWGHVAAGAVAVLAGTVALVTRKGGRAHRRAGRVFVATMGLVVASTFGLLALAPDAFRVFLSLVAVFSGYLAFSGYRALSRRRPAGGPAPVDWVAAGAVVVACVALGGWGVAWLLAGDTFGVAMGLFGAIGVGFGVQDARQFRAPAGPSTRTVAHLQRMLGAFVATVSAVSAVNLTTHLGVLAWILPTVLATPLIAYWSNEHGPG